VSLFRNNFLTELDIPQIPSLRYVKT